MDGENFNTLCRGERAASDHPRARESAPGYAGERVLRRAQRGVKGSSFTAGARQGHAAIDGEAVGVNALRLAQRFAVSVEKQVVAALAIVPTVALEESVGLPGDLEPLLARLDGAVELTRTGFKTASPR
jgi:hypothetical protein